MEKIPSFKTIAKVEGVRLHLASFLGLSVSAKSEVVAKEGQKFCMVPKGDQISWYL